MCAIGNYPTRLHRFSPGSPAPPTSNITGVVTAAGLTFGPPHIATRWGEPPCPLLPRQYLSQYGDLELPFRLVPNLPVYVDQLGEHFWIYYRHEELPVNFRMRLLTWISKFPFPDDLPGIPGGLPRSWLRSLPLGSSTLDHVHKLNSRTNLSDITPPDLRSNFGFTNSEIIELHCVIETADCTNRNPLSPVYERESSERRNQSGFGTSGTFDIARYISDPLRHFATWATHETTAETLDQAITIARSRNKPLSEWEVLASLPLTKLYRPSLQFLDTILNNWVQNLDRRDRTIFLERIMPSPAQRRTLEAIARDLGYTRERIRQLEKLIRSRLTEFAGSSSGSPLRWRVESVRYHLGIAAPIDHAVVYTVTREGRRSQYSDLVLNLAGPYIETNGWLIRKSAIASEPTRLIKDVATDDYGRIDLVKASKLLREWGLDDSHHISFLTRDKYIQYFQDQLVRWDGPITNKLALILDDSGKPATAESLLDIVGLERSIRSVKNAMSADSRFIRTSVTEWGLSHWGLEEYNGIVSMIAAAIKRTVEPIHVDDMAVDISGRFNVSEASVRSYCGAAKFVVEAGYIRLRCEKEPFIYSSPDLSNAKGVFALDTGLISLLYAVDSDVLRGSGRQLGMTVGSLLRVDVNERLALRGPDGTSTVVTFPESSFLGPSLGSTRGLAELAGAAEGDLLTLIINRHAKTVDVRATNLSVYQRGWGLIARLTGISEERGIEHLSRSLGCTPGEVRATLRNRGDLAVLDSMPAPRVPSDLADALAKLEAEVDRISSP